MLTKGHWYLWETNEEGQAGVVRPSALSFETVDDGNTMMARYVALYPKSAFALRLAITKHALGLPFNITKASQFTVQR